MVADDGNLREQQAIVNRFEAVDRVLTEKDRYFEHRITALEKLCFSAIESLEKNTKDTFIAAEKSVKAAFAGTEKAVLKAEEAQKEYNIRSNEFRGQLDDQAKTLMPRPESLGLHRATAEKLDAIRSEFEKRLELLREEISSLREYRMQGAGHTQGMTDMRVALLAVLGAIGTILSIAAILMNMRRP